MKAICKQETFQFYISAIITVSSEKEQIANMRFNST